LPWARRPATLASPGAAPGSAGRPRGIEREERTTPTTWTILNPGGRRRTVVTKELPGARWRQILIGADCRVEVGGGSGSLGEADLIEAIGERCDAAIGQLTEPWNARVLQALGAAGAAVYSAYAAGLDNVDVGAATSLGLPVGNTPGVLTEATAEMAVALTFAAARRVAEGDRLTRHGVFQGWLPAFLLGELLWRRTLGVIGAGRIGGAYARMMVEGHKMDLLYFSPQANPDLEDAVASYSAFLVSHGDAPVRCRRASDLGELLAAADVVSLHTPLSESTRHLIGAEELAAMKPHAILVNTSRGPVVDEDALVRHCRTHSTFRAGLDVFEREPALAGGLAELENVVLAPHLGSATGWTREGMATLAAANIAAILQGWPVWPRATSLGDVLPFLEGDPPKAAPSIVNAEALGLRRLPPSA
jgi:glycerate dehydrogenase